jgi:hypothetical protein
MNDGMLCTSFSFSFFLSWLITYEPIMHSKKPPQFYMGTTFEDMHAYTEVKIHVW